MSSVKGSRGHKSIGIGILVISECVLNAIGSCVIIDVVLNPKISHKIFEISHLQVPQDLKESRQNPTHFGKAILVVHKWQTNRIMQRFYNTKKKAVQNLM